ncbi:MAG: cytochrome c-type biogenesis protein CcmH [Gammaproteobacteria bacterium]|nr:cytochrome c-type biogenesis protein CcmH [Gammaproteobacteria bacterium]
MYSSRTLVKLVLTLALTLTLLTSMSLSQATIVAFDFNDPQKEARFKKFSEELRCLVCQNQSLADSNAELAMDLRRELYKMIQNEATDDDIVEFMVNRYGDFVLYRPPVKSTTWLLWFGPFVLVFIGLIILFKVIRAVNKGGNAELSTEEQQRLHNMLKNKNEDNLS